MTGRAPRIEAEELHIPYSIVKMLSANTNRRPIFSNRPKGLCIGWKMKITESRYGYSEVIAEFSMFVLVSLPLEITTVELEWIPSWLFDFLMSIDQPSK